MIENKRDEVKAEMFAVLKQALSEMTGNKIEDIREDSLIFNELNLTEFDLLRVIKEVGNRIGVDGDQLSRVVSEGENIVAVSDVLELIVDEKELG